jgi:hypothetical protein
MRSIVVITTVTDDGHIRVDVRGKADLEAVREILKAAMELAEQGKVSGGVQET